MRWLRLSRSGGQNRPVSCLEIGYELPVIRCVVGVGGGRLIGGPFLTTPPPPPPARGKVPKGFKRGLAPLGMHVPQNSLQVSPSMYNFSGHASGSSAFSFIALAPEGRPRKYLVKRCALVGGGCPNCCFCNLTAGRIENNKKLC